MVAQLTKKTWNKARNVVNLLRSKARKSQKEGTIKQHKNTNLSTKLPEAVGAMSNKEAKEELKALIGEKAAKPAGRVAGFSQKVLWDLEMFSNSPYEQVARGVRSLGSELWRLEVELPEQVVDWIKQTTTGMKIGGKHPILNKLPRDFMVANGVKTFEDVKALLVLFGIKNKSDNVFGGVYDIGGHILDLDQRMVNGKYLMPAAVSFGPLGGAAALDSNTLLYVVVSMMLREACSDEAGAARAVRELLEMMDRCFESPKVGLADDARKDIERSKPALLKLLFDQFGLTLLKSKVKAENRGDVFTQVSNELPGTGAHPQGKYFTGFEDVGISLSAAPEFSPNMGRQEYLMAHMQRKALVGSTDVTKWFKRLTLAMPQQARLVHPEVGYMTTKGAAHEGKRTAVLIVLGGIPLPYLGNSVALQPRKVVGEHFAHYSEDIIDETWTGIHAVGGPDTGSLITKGDLIASGNNMAIYARRDGILLQRTVVPRDGETLVIVKVGEADLDGQVKSRSYGGGKESLVWLYNTGSQEVWPELMAALGLSGDYINGGDTAILGLRSDYKPMFTRGEDSNKAVGKGAAMGQTALACETLERHADYTVVKDKRGDFDQLKADFKKTAECQITQLWSVDGNTFAHVSKTVAKGKAHKGVSCYKIDLDGEMFYIIRQDATAYQTYDLIKVESLPVADCLTTQRVQGEVVVGCNAAGLPHTARSILMGGKSQLKEYARLQQVAWCDPIWLEKNQGKLTWFDGSQEEVHTINLNTAINKGTVDRFLELGNSKEGLASLERPVAIGFWDEYNSFSDNAVILDPVVLNTFGGGKDKSSCEMLARNLCSLVGIFGATRLNKQAVERQISRFRGVMQKLAKAKAVAKRVQRGSAAVQMRSRAAFVPTDWVAMSYYGQAIHEIARATGWTPKSGVKVGDFVAGAQTVVFRAPQFNVTPQRIYCPDAPEAVIEQWKLDGKWPEGAKRYTDGRMEPSVAYISPLATANDHGK